MKVVLGDVTTCISWRLGFGDQLCWLPGYISHSKGLKSIQHDILIIVNNGKAESETDIERQSWT